MAARRADQLEVGRAEPLTQILELLEGHSELAQDFEKEGRPDFALPWRGIVTARPSAWFQRSWLPVWRVFEKPNCLAAFCRSRAVALGMYDFRGVSGEWDAPLAVLLGDHFKDATEFGEGLSARGHKGVAA